nr:retrovirus-related Pol polyprotein from transposon TNT 1-94 [Tanacetum cinerariifolium]
MGRSRECFGTVQVLGIVHRCLQRDDILNVQAIEAAGDSLAVPEHTVVETPMNMSPENKAHFLAEKEAIHLILTRIGDEIYSTVVACQTTQEMWEAIERHKDKEIAKPITPPFETASEEDSDPEQAQMDKDMQKNLALIAKYFKKIYKPTNNNLRTSSNSKNKNVDTTPRFKNDNQSGQLGNQRAECRKPERVKDSAYHKEKMLLCKQTEQGVPLQAEQYDWLADMDEEVDEHELEAHYSYMAKIQEIQKQLKKANTTLAQELKECKVILAETSKSLRESISVRDSCLVALQTKQTEFEKYKASDDRTIDYDKLERKLNEALGQLAQKDTVIKEGLKTKAYELLVVKEKNDELIKQSLLTKSHYEGLVKQKTKVITDLKLREEHDIEKMLSLEKQLTFLNEVVYKRSQSIQTIHMMAPKVSTYKGRPTFANPRYLKQAQSEISCLYAFPYDQNTHANRLIPDGEETLALERESRSKLNKDSVRPYDYTTLNSLYEIFKPPNPGTCLMPLAIKTQNDSFKFVHELKQEMHADLKYVESLEKEIDELKSDKAEFSNMYNVILQECKGKSVDTKSDRPSVVQQPNAQRIPKPSVLVDSNHFACVTKMLNDVHARTKNLTVVPISTRKPKSQANKSIATPNKKKVALKSNNQKPQSYFGMLYENTISQFCDADLEVAFRKSTCFVRDLQGNDLLTGNRGSDLYTISLQESTSSTPLCLMANATPTQEWLRHRRLSHLNFDYINLLSKKDIVIVKPA